MTSRNVPRLRFKGFGDEWRNSILSNLSSIFDGVHKTPNYVKHGIPFYSVENLKTMKTDKYICSEEYESNFKKNIPEYGDILMSRIGSIGEVNLVNSNKSLAFYVTLALIKPNNKELTSLFLNSTMQSPSIQKELWRRTLHVAFPKKINKNEIGNVAVNYPSLSEQQHIGNFFSKLDHLIDLHSQKLEQLKKLKRGYLQKMFPQKGKTVPRLRFSGFSGKWEEVKLGDICKVKMGQSPHSKNYTSDSTQDILVQGNADLSKGKVMPRLYTTEETRISDKDDIIMTVRAPVGELAINQFNKIVIGRGVSSIKGNEFIYNALKKIDMDHTWDRVSSGSTFQAVNSEDIKSLNIKMPTIVEQQKLGELFKMLDNNIELCIEKIIKLKKQKEAYLQKMFI